MPQRPPKQMSPAEVIASCNKGYNGYTDPTITKPDMWRLASNVFSGAFGYIQRCRFANVVNLSPTTGQPFTSLKYFGLPGLGAWLLGDINGQLFSFDTGNSYAKTQRLNPYVDPAGTGSASLNGPWSREVIQNIVYEMNGTVKAAGRLANAATIEGFGLDAPDASPQVQIQSGVTANITSIARSNGVVTTVLASTFGVPIGSVINVASVTDTSFNGSFVVVTNTAGPTPTLTWSQFGQNVSSSGGNCNTNVTKAIGRSYAWAWENANKSHVGAPSPATQYIAFTNQNGVIQLIEPGVVAVTGGSAIVTGTGTFFTSAWIGRSLWAEVVGNLGRIASVQSSTQLTLAISQINTQSGLRFQIFDPQATHIRLYATADGGATYFRIARNAWVPSAGGTIATPGLQFTDSANTEPPNLPFTSEVAQTNNLPPPVGQFIKQYQGRPVVFGITGALQTFFYGNSELTSIGQAQESFAPLNQVTLPIANGQIYGYMEFPGTAIFLSDKQDMFRLSGLLSDNSISTAAQQGATIARLPYNLGSAHPEACIITPLGGLWVTSNAEIWLYTDRYAPRNVGRPVQDILSSVSPSMLSKARAKYFHANNRNWAVFLVAANQDSKNNTALVLDLDLLASNGSPSYFVFDMATNHPAFWVLQPGPVVSQTVGGVTTTFNQSRCDSLEVVYETNGIVRLLSGSVDLIQDIDYQQGGFGTEIQVFNSKVGLHPWGNDSAPVIKRPTWFRFNTNRDPSLLQSDGWSFEVDGVDDDFYTFANPLQLVLIPGLNDSSTLGGNPDFVSGLAFRHSPEMYRIGGVNFVMGRRLMFTINFPTGTGVNYQFRAVQLGFGPSPPR